MNPWTVVVIVLGIILIIAGVKGTQDNLISVVTGKPHGKTNLSH